MSILLSLEFSVGLFKTILFLLELSVTCSIILRACPTTLDTEVDEQLISPLKQSSDPIIMIIEFLKLSSFFISSSPIYFSCNLFMR